MSCINLEKYGITVLDGNGGVFQGQALTGGTKISFGKERDQRGLRLDDGMP